MENIKTQLPGIAKQIHEIADNLQDEFILLNQEVSYEICLLLTMKIMDGMALANYYYPTLIQSIDKKSKNGINLI